MSLGLMFALLLAYSAMLSLCLGLERHYKQLFQRTPTSMIRRGLRALGWTALLGSLVVSVMLWGWAMGPVGWLGLVSLTGLALAILLPYALRLSVSVASLGWPVLAVSALI